MDLGPFEATGLETGAAILSGGSALIAILAGVEQVSSSSRAKKNIEWLQTSLQYQGDGPRGEALEKNLVQNEAKLIARQEVPLWYFSPILVWLVGVAAALYSASDEHNSIFGLILAVISIIAFGLNLIRATIRAYCERTRIYYQYGSEKYKFRPAETDILALMEGGTRKEFIQSGFLLLGISVCSATIVLSVQYGTTLWRLVIFIVSIVLVFFTCFAVNAYAYEQAGDASGGVSAFQRRINIRRMASSLLGPDLENKLDEIDKSIQTAKQLSVEVDEAMKPQIKDVLDGQIQDLKEIVNEVVTDLESLRNELTSSVTGSDFITMGKRLEQINERIKESKRLAQYMRSFGIE